MSIGIQLETAKALSQFHINDNVKMKLEGLNLIFGIIEDLALTSSGELLIGVRWLGEWRPDYVKASLQYVHHTKVNKL
jgi:hypothetical protein